MFFAVKDFINAVNFTLQEVPKHLISREEVCNHCCTRMGPMCCSKGIVHITVSMLSQLPCEELISGFFFLVKSEVFKKEHFSGLQS